MASESCCISWCFRTTPCLVRVNQLLPSGYASCRCNFPGSYLLLLAGASRLKDAGSQPGPCLCRYSYANAPIQKELHAAEVGAAAAFLVSPLASAITGTVLHVDNGLHAMGLATDSSSLALDQEPAKA